MKEPILIKNSAELLLGSKFTVSETVEQNQGKVLFREWAEPSTEVAHFDFHAKDGAKLEYVLFQNHAVSSDAVAKITLRADRDAEIKFTIIQQGASKSQVEIIAHCAGQGSVVEIRGLQNAKSTQKMSVDFKSFHEAPHTKTDLQIWCVARDTSHSIFNALVSIKPGSHHSEAYQKNKNLLLSPKATVDTFPKLFIANDDVKAAHGSSTSTLEPEQFIYLQSRGIDHDAAEVMLTNGFMNQSFDWLSDAGMKTRIAKTLGIAEEEEWV